MKSLLSAGQVLGQDEMRRDWVTFVGRSKPKTWKIQLKKLKEKQRVKEYTCCSSCFFRLVEEKGAMCVCQAGTCIK